MMDISDKLPPIPPMTNTHLMDTSQKTDATRPVRPASGGDSVSLSHQARWLQAAREALAEIPEIREERVAAIRAQIEAGTYKVDGEKIADKMIAEGLLNTHLK
jgi:negative regulator of flagellin synthesis FlgM